MDDTIYSELKKIGDLYGDRFDSFVLNMPQD
jgi:hypothetical protein